MEFYSYFVFLCLEEIYEGDVLFENLKNWELVNLIKLK